MGLIKTKGIVIGVANSADNDKVLTVLTPDLGKISVFCKGAKKSKSALLNATEYLAFSELIIYKSANDNYSINSAEVIEVFYNLRIDIEKLNYATTISKIIYDVTQENDWLGHFISECCDVDASYTEKSGELYQAYRAYAVQNGEFTRQNGDFYSALENAGFSKRKTKKGAFFYGLKLKEGQDFL